MSFKTEGSLRTQIHSIPEEQDGLRVPWLELVQNSPLTEKCEQSACWGSSTFPLPMVLWECMQLLKVRCFEWWLTYSTVYCEKRKKKKKKSLPPSLKKKKKCRTPTKQAHMYHVQGLSSNIGLNGMPHFQPLCTCLIIAQRFVVVRLRVQLHANDSCVTSWYIFLQMFFTICDVQGIYATNLRPCRSRDLLRTIDHRC